MTDILRQPLSSRMAWRGEDLRTSECWIDRISPAEQAELRAAADQLPEDPARWPDYGREALPLPTLGVRIAQMAEELESGRGFVLMRGLDVAGEPALMRRLYWVIGAHFGRMVAQNGNGDLVGEVTDRGGRYGVDPHARGYTSRAEMRFHSDPTDVVSLLCINPARSGGESSIVSMMTIYNEILAEAPEILETLYSGFRYYFRLSETASEGAQGLISRHRDPAYLYADGRLSAGINPQSIRSLPRVTGEPLPEAERVALETVERLAEKPGLSLTFTLQAGDLLLVDNYMVLHKRAEFVDFDEPERKRLLLRFWINLHNGRPLPAGSSMARNHAGFNPAAVAAGAAS